MFLQPTGTYLTGQSVMKERVPTGQKMHHTLCCLLRRLGGGELEGLGCSLKLSLPHQGGPYQLEQPGSNSEQ